MQFTFDINKAVACSGYLLEKEGGQTTVFVLMKMLYAAEREALSGWKRPITGDSFAALPKGPILSRIYNLIKKEVLSTNSDMKKWSQHFSDRVGNNIKLICPPDYDYLSDREKNALDVAHKKIKDLIAENGQIADILHKKWAEWKDPAIFGKGSIPIEFQDILSQFMDEEEVFDVCSEIKSVQSAKATLQVYPI